MLTKMADTLYFRDRKAWRAWLRRNHARADGIWLLTYRKVAGRKGVSHPEALEEALCFGWIDSQMKKLDDIRFVQRYTPRRPGSGWSQVNKDLALRLIREGRMTAAGVREIDEAKRLGLWAKAYSAKRGMRLPSDLKKALMRDQRAWKNFQAFANTYKTMYIGWVKGAKREETRTRRIATVVKQARRKLKPGVGM